MQPGINIHKPGKPLTASALRLIAATIFITAALTLTVSCDKAYDGWPGRAYVALAWYGHEPDYIEMGNEYIPALFYWNEYYRVAPGMYWIYYEGRYRRGGRDYEYSWELEYEVWEVPGTRGKPFRDGEDGPDAWFTIELTPDGPEVLYEESYPLKSALSNDDAGLILQNEDEIIFEKYSNNYGIRIRYKKAHPRSAGE